MRTHHLALIGFGGVNRALAELVAREPERFTALGFQLRVVAISDLEFGSLIVADGIDLEEVLRLERGTTFATLSGGRPVADNESVIRDTTADIVIEATFTDPSTGEPAASHVRWALEAGKHVVTTNKGPVALHREELTALAAAHGVQFRYEGSVLSGTPVLNLARIQFAGLEIRGVEGILNGTSNFVLGRREAGLSHPAAVLEAQELGYAEADPTADIEGGDARLKIAILANELFDARLAPSDVPTRGISGISDTDLAAAARDGKRWKLLGSVERRADGTVSARVAPVALDLDHPLAGIAGATNAITFDTDLLGRVTISGPGAGRHETAFALIADIVAIDALAADPVPA